MRRLHPLLAATGLAGFALAACSPQAPIHNKAYFAANAAERARTLARCEADPGRLSATSDCVNAHAADTDAQAAHFYDAPNATARVEQSGKL